MLSFLVSECEWLGGGLFQKQVTKHHCYCVTCGVFTDISQQKLPTGSNVRWNVRLHERLHHVEHIKQQSAKGITKKATPCGCRRL